MSTTFLHCHEDEDEDEDEDETKIMTTTTKNTFFQLIYLIFYLCFYLQTLERLSDPVGVIFFIIIFQSQIITPYL